MSLFLSSPVPSRAPQSPYGVALSPFLIDIIWLPPPAIHINGEIDFYIVEAIEIITNRFLTYHAVEDHIFVGPVRPGYAYRCRVAAFTVGQGPFTNYFIVTSQELGMSMHSFYDKSCIIIIFSPSIGAKKIVVLFNQLNCQLHVFCNIIIPCLY